jgi:hypothetical protein
LQVIDFLPGLLRRLELLQEELLSEVRILFFLYIPLTSASSLRKEQLKNRCYFSGLGDVKLIILQGTIILECYRCILISIKTLVTWVTGRQGEYPKLAKVSMSTV